MRALLIIVIVLCLLGIEATYDAEYYQESVALCDYPSEWWQRRCKNDAADLHPTGVILLGIVSITSYKLKELEKSNERQTAETNCSNG
ncbi:hypothetical protein VPHK449_0053 [Vibrio phage K449]